MKTLISKINQGQEMGRGMPIIRSKLATVVAAALGICMTLGALPATAQNKDDTNPDTVVTFSGGGYHALSGAASWMMGMMAREGTNGTPASLKQVTSNVDAYGSNSGGSWFMSLSSYSPTFLEELNASAQYPDIFTSSGGYMGLAWDRLHNETICKDGTDAYRASCVLIKGILDDLKLSGLAKLLLAGQAQWQVSIDKDVFGGPVMLDKRTDILPYYPEIQDKKLSDEKLDWIKGKDWVLAGTFLTESPSLTYTSIDRLGFQGVQSLEGMVDNTFFNQSFPDKFVDGGVPVMLTSATGIDFLPAGDLNITYGIWDKAKFNANTNHTTTISNSAINQVMKDLPVMHAAGISSAAGGGFIDIPNLRDRFPLGTKKIATALNGLAPAYQLNSFADSGNQENPTLTFIENVHESFAGNNPTQDALNNTMKENQIVRMADGGFMDNTAVAQMLRYLQDKNSGNIPDGFNIIAFDDFPDTQTQWSDKSKTLMPTGNDIASLFGFTGCKGKGKDKKCTILEKDQVTHAGGLFGFKFTGVSPQVFSCDQYFTKGTPTGNQICAGAPDTSHLYWWPDTDNEKIDCGGTDQPLTYAKYEVTVDNTLPGSHLYGLKNNAKGTLHVFSTLGKGAAVVPNNEDGLVCYNTLVNKIVSNVKAKGTSCDTSKPKSTSNKCTLGDYLEAALN